MYSLHKINCVVSVPHSGAAETTATKAEQEAAETLRRIGDDIQRQYESGGLNIKLNTVITSVLKNQTYETFSNGLTELWRWSRESASDAATSDSTMNSVAISMFAIQKIAEAAKTVGSNLRETKQLIVYGDIFIKKTYGEGL